jgi:hypothetical protein
LPQLLLLSLQGLGFFFSRKIVIFFQVYIYLITILFRHTGKIVDVINITLLIDISVKFGPQYRRPAYQKAQN